MEGHFYYNYFEIFSIYKINAIARGTMDVLPFILDQGYLAFS